MKIQYKNEIVYIDTEDLQLFSSYTWHFYGNKTNKYLRSAKRINSKKIEYILFHRLIMNVHKLDYKQYMIDHINGNGLDNRKINLRIVDNKRNQLNSKNHSDSKVPYKGIYYRNDRKKFIARININGKRKVIGSFDTDYDAAKAYDQYILDNDLIFNKLNF